jgi:hypothetical protein
MIESLEQRRLMSGDGGSYPIEEMSLSFSKATYIKQDGVYAAPTAAPSELRTEGITIHWEGVTRE